METGVNKAYMKARKSIMIPGFRKGKAPRKMIESMYGAHVFYDDGLEEIFPEIYQFAVVEQDVKAIGRPSLTDVNIDENDIVTITLPTDELTKEFLKGATQAGLVNLKGHRSVGGVRASIYNAMPVEGVQALIDYMKAFELAHK